MYNHQSFADLAAFALVFRASKSDRHFHEAVESTLVLPTRFDTFGILFRRISHFIYPSMRWPIDRIWIVISSGIVELGEFFNEIKDSFATFKDAFLIFDSFLLASDSLGELLPLGGVTHSSILPCARLRLIIAAVLFSLLGIVSVISIVAFAVIVIVIV